MDYQLRSRGIVPTLSYRNPYRYIGPLVRRTKNQRGGLFRFNKLRSRGITPTLPTRRRQRGGRFNKLRSRGITPTLPTRRTQRGGQIDMLTPAMLAWAKTLRSEAKYGRKKQRGKGLKDIVAGAAKIGYKLGKEKDYRRMGLTGAAQSSYRRLPRPWEFR